MRVVADWMQFYNHRRSHQVRGIMTPPRPMPWRPDLCRNGWVIARVWSEQISGLAFQHDQAPRGRASDFINQAADDRMIDPSPLHGMRL